MAKVNFSADNDLGKKLKEWWQELENDRGQRAELRRAKSVHEVIMLPCFHRACRQFASLFGRESRWQSRLALIMAMLSHVKQLDSDKKLAAQMAEGSDKPVVSELRFRRLLQCERDKLFVALIRVIHLLDGQANIYDIANSCFYWGDNVKKHWVFAYFSKIKS